MLCFNVNIFIFFFSIIVFFSLSLFSLSTKKKNNKKNQMQVKEIWRTSYTHTNTHRATHTNIQFELHLHFNKVNIVCTLLSHLYDIFSYSPLRGFKQTSILEHTHAQTTNAWCTLLACIIWEYNAQDLNCYRSREKGEKGEKVISLRNKTVLNFISLG